MELEVLLKTLMKTIVLLDNTLTLRSDRSKDENEKLKYAKLREIVGGIKEDCARLIARMSHEKVIDPLMEKELYGE
jgi:hypothetical protein